MAGAIGRLAPLAAAAALLWLGAGTATTEPAAIEAQRAEVARLQSQLDGINMQVEQAAEAYNGARYQLGLVEERLAENRLRLQRARDLRLRQVRQERPPLSQFSTYSGYIGAVRP